MKNLKYHTTKDIHSIDMKIFVQLIFGLIIFCSGCSTEKYLITSKIVNEWRRAEETSGSSDLYLLKFFNDGTFYLSLGEIKSDGIYNIVENQLMIRSESCGENEGIYFFKITAAGILQISIDHDFCSPRVQHFAGIWLPKNRAQ